MEVSDIRVGAQADLPSLPLPPAIDEWLDDLPGRLLTLLDTIASRGAGVWLVGGCVRDATSTDRRPGDVDIATTLTPNEMLSLFPRAIDTGSRFGTVTLRCDQRSDDDETYEATSLRTETTYGDGRRPDEVRFGRSLAEDLRRRDLTMNAMAVDVSRRCLHDPYGGLADLEGGLLRAVGVAGERLREDGLRILRAYRFMDDRSGGVRTLDADLATALIEEAECIERVSIERVWQELARILAGPSAGAVLARMEEDGILARVLGGGLAPASAGGADRSAFPTIDDDLAIIGRLSALLSPLSPEDASARLRGLTAPRRVVSIVAAVQATMALDPDISSNEQLRVFRTALGDLLPARILATAGHDPEVGLSLSRAIGGVPPLSAGEAPLVDGHALMEATGLPQGERLGRLKSWLHLQQIMRDLANADAVLATLAEIDWRSGDPAAWPTVRWP